MGVLRRRARLLSAPREPLVNHLKRSDLGLTPPTEAARALGNLASRLNPEEPSYQDQIRQYGAIPPLVGLLLQHPDAFRQPTLLGDGAHVHFAEGHGNEVYEL